MRPQYGNHAVREKDKRVFVKRCPAPDCRGFLSNKWNCGLCETKVCSKCQEIKTEGDDHVCNSDILKTVQLMAGDSKPCPKSGDMITRISGCPQMFHTPLSGGCGAIFDWNTLRISDAASGVHNPHWFEYLRKINNGHVPRTDDVCNNNTMPSPQTVMAVINMYCSPDKQQDITTHLLTIIRGHTHMRMIQLPRYTHTVNNINDNRDLRIKYLLDEISEDQLKAMVLKREKAREKNREYTQIIQMYLDAVQDILIRITQVKSLEQFMETKSEVHHLIDYTNASFAKAQKLYKSSITLTICNTRYYMLYCTPRGKWKGYKIY
jgi:hypothetical protein